VSTAIAPAAVAPGDHVVQFYEHDADLVDGVARYLGDGPATVVIATRPHRDALAARLREPAAVRWLDAEETLAGIVRDGGIDSEAFFARLGGVVREAAAGGRPVRLFGEMVALVWEAGDVLAAIELEALWNALAEQVPFSLYCAYRTEAVAGQAHADALERVCGLHSAVVTAPAAETTWRFAADPASAGAARRALVAALRGRGHREQFLDDARLVVTELAANAIVHGRSEFSVSLHDAGSTLRILVRDWSPAPPVLREALSTAVSGRGLRLVDALAGRWGVDPTPDGKIVWAELRR
jgi:anti-sigma regulatory factor (Ser/Thr protein kinase)